MTTDMYGYASISISIPRSTRAGAPKGRHRGPGRGGGGGGQGRGPGRRRGRPNAADFVPCDESDAAAWFAGRLPDGWFVEPPSVKVDRDEILVTGILAKPTVKSDDEPNSRADQTDSRSDPAQVAAEARIAGFRSESRQQRMRIAEEAQGRWQRVVSWAAVCGETEQVFTHAAVPVMTRLRMDQRHILDTLISSGVVRSRSEAMAWCVNQVGEHQGEWFDRLRSAMSEVEKIRSEGP